VGEGADDEPADVRGRAVDGRLAEEDDVAAGEIHILVRRVIRRRPSYHGPVRRGVDVPHVDAERHERPHASAVRRQRRAREKPRHDGLLGALPGQPDADVDRLNLARGRLVGDQNRAVQAAGKQHCGLHLVIG
jgi:hypothetical protein